jgi:CHRD domain-containing protein
MRRIVVLGAVVALVLAGTAIGITQEGFKQIMEALSGLKEVPVISTTGFGSFTATISKDETEIQYQLTYEGMEGAVTQSHIHFGPPNNTGGISVWFCSNLASPPTPAGVPACPQSATGNDVITGTITAEDVVGPTGQGIEAGALGELIAAIRDGKTYVNVHSTKWPGGEIRSQITHDHGHER